MHGVNPEDALSEIKHIQEEISQVESSIVDFKNAAGNCKDVVPEETCEDMKKFILTLEEQAKTVEDIIKATKSNTETDLARWDEFLNRVNNVSVLVEQLHNEIDDIIERDPNTTTEVRILFYVLVSLAYLPTKGLMYFITVSFNGFQ